MAGPEGSRYAGGPSRVPREQPESPVWLLRRARRRLSSLCPHLSPEPCPKLSRKSLQIKDSEEVHFLRGVSLQRGELPLTRLVVERGSQGQADAPGWSPHSRSLASPVTRPQWRKCLKTNRPKTLPEASRWAEDSGANNIQSVTRVAGSPREGTGVLFLTEPKLHLEEYKQVLGRKMNNVSLFPGSAYSLSMLLQLCFPGVFGGGKKSQRSLTLLLTISPPHLLSSGWKTRICLPTVTMGGSSDGNNSGTGKHLYKVSNRRTRRENVATAQRNANTSDFRPSREASIP
ncbi:uncharacterized protein J5F26_009580 [Ciconia maguari]